MHALKKGDWVFHRLYGIGQVECIEQKALLGEQTKLYRVEGRDAKFWIPVDGIDTDRIRPLAKKIRFREIGAVLRKKPEKMKTDFRSRVADIKERMEDGSVLALSRLYRDLSGRRKRRNSLTPTEQRIYEQLQNQIISEWAVVMGISEEQALSKLNGYLSDGLAQVAAA